MDKINKNIGCDFAIGVFIFYKKNHLFQNFLTACICQLSQLPNSIHIIDYDILPCTSTPAPSKHATTSVVILVICLLPVTCLTSAGNQEVHRKISFQNVYIHFCNCFKDITDIMYDILIIIMITYIRYWATYLSRKLDITVGKINMSVDRKSSAKSHITY